MDDLSAALSQIGRLSRKDSLSDRIYFDLKTRLQRCEIGPDLRLQDHAIAAHYGTSRLPAREALLRLVNEGYLTATHRGYKPVSLSLQDIREIFEVRQLIEPQAAANAARNMTKAEEAHLTAAYLSARSAIEKGDGQRLISAKIDFRAAWLKAVRNERLAATITRFSDHVQAVRLATLVDAGVQQIVAIDLEALYHAFIARNPEAAAAQIHLMLGAEQAFLSVRRAEIAAEAATAI